MIRYRHATTLPVLGVLLGLAGPVDAQRPRHKSPQERYEDMKKSPFLAATLEWIVPTVGHDYAGDREAGKPAAYLTMAAAGSSILPRGHRFTDVGRRGTDRPRTRAGAGRSGFSGSPPC